ncbi:MAG: ATP-binding protein, partial [Thermovirgaceae bacterium]|nr:ATP-binding protein [Thermovirgaceae bacterium]
DAMAVLENLHIVREGQMTNAGAWLLASYIQKFNISADVACALFMGVDKVRILDRRGFNSDVYSMIDEVVTYILSKINVEYIIKHVKREERPELPEEALREAVVNALAHRDYRSTANVQIYIFKDRIEIVSPGGLPAGMTEADLGIKSIPRNPLLFAMLHRMEAVEHIGSGIKRIRDLCREYGVAEPRIEVSEHWFTMIFLRPGVEPETEPGLDTPHDTQHDTQHDTPHVVKLAEVLGGDMNREEIMIALGLKDRMHFANYYLKPALDSDVIEMTIPDKPRSKNQRYRLSAKGKLLLASREKSRK